MIGKCYLGFIFETEVEKDRYISPFISENITFIPYVPSPKELEVFKKAYSDVSFITKYDVEKKDYAVYVKIPNHEEKKFYWCDGKFLPEEELINSEKYGKVLYLYDKELRDPASLTTEEKEKLKEFTSASNRKNGSGTSMFLFDYIYDAPNQIRIEEHIKTIRFLNHRTKVHERILEPLKNVERKILEIAETDEDVKIFVNKIKSTDAYYWRQIAGTNRKSFHSLGIAIDILPVKITGEMFWSWTKEKNPDSWMLTPFSSRWTPPEKVIEAFEEEGFIWGGKWMIWDNMHFEYHPELMQDWD